MSQFTLRQRRFIDHYVQCGIGAEPARRAGYAKGSADVTVSRLLANARVAMAMAQKLTEAGETEADIVAGLRAREDAAAAAGQFGPAARALELRGRRLGMWQAKASTGAGKVIVNIFDSSATVETDGEMVRVSGNDERVIAGETA